VNRSSPQKNPFTLRIYCHYGGKKPLPELAKSSVDAVAFELFMLHKLARSQDRDVWLDRYGKPTRQEQQGPS
jgi:hypothetical protein